MARAEGLLHFPCPPFWEHVGGGFDSVVFKNTSTKQIIHAYPERTEGEVTEYATLVNGAAAYLLKHPFQTSISGVPFTLMDVVKVESVDYNDALKCWTTSSSCLDGPNVSAFMFSPNQYLAAVERLQESEQNELIALWNVLQRVQAMRSGMHNLARSATGELVRVLKNSGIDIIFENLKLRKYAGDRRFRLIITDLTPSLERIVNNRSIFV